VTAGINHSASRRRIDLVLVRNYWVIALDECRIIVGARNARKSPVQSWIAKLRAP
jgi:hypothetical protein